MNGWTLEEIHGIALKELHEFSKIAAENEPENLAYWDPSKMYDEADVEDKDYDKKE